LNPYAVRRLDAWLGKPGCFALTVLRRAVGLVRPAKTFNKPPKNILLIKMIEQGATVLAYRAIARAVEKVGRENVYFWVFENNRFILDVLKLVPPENVLVVRTTHPLLLMWDLLRTAFCARRLGIDATVDMEFFSRASAILAFLTGAQRRVGLHRFTSEGPYRGDLMTHRVQYNPHLHTAAAYYMLVDALDADPKQIPLMKTAVPGIDFSAPPFRPSDDETDRVRAILDRVAGHKVESPLVLLNPNASDLLPLRRWATERFIELGKRILANHPYATIAITGAPDEAGAAEAIARQIGPAAVSLAGHTTLRELIVVYTLADVLVTNDSGPGHFASMTNVTSIVLFGPETPAVFGPLSTNTHVVRADIACSPCVNPFNHRFSPCNDNVCMQMISVDQVYELVDERLSGKPKMKLTVIPETLVAVGRRQPTAVGPQ
jgi:ADP-heptose:LPS heptosyltransferase